MYARTSGARTRLRMLAHALLACCAVAMAPPVVGTAQGAKRFQMETSNLNNRISLSPARGEYTVQPGKASSVEITLANWTTQQVHATITIVDLEPSKDPNGFIQESKNAPYGAKTWINPELTDVTLASGEQIQFMVIVKPPADAPVGSSYAGLEATVVAAKHGSGPASVGFRMTGLAQLFFTIPGEVQRSGSVSKVRATPRWSFHGSFISYDFEYANTGTTTAHVGGKVPITSMFGNTIHSIGVKDRYVLRGGSRTVHLVWTDPPAFGRFRARAVLDIDGREVTVTFPNVYILPPWWWFVIAGTVLLLPVLVVLRRRRQMWLTYLEDDDLDGEFDDLDETDGGT